MTSQIIPVNASQTALVSSDESRAFTDLATLTVKTIAVSSARIYGQTYTAWQAHCEQIGLSPLELRPAAVMDFLIRQSATKATRQRQLSALRKLAQMAFILTPNDDTRRFNEALKVLKAPAPDAKADRQERSKRALTPAEADKLLRAWDDNSPQHRRNRALIAVLLMTGIRRAEAAALCWRDVDFENGVITIRHGKGDKSRNAPVAGDLALDALRYWHMLQPADRDYVFCPVERGGHIGKDKPITGTDVYRVVKATEAATGVEFKPHDARRTFITEALATGTPIADVQAAAGHARGDTTLRYAQAVDARRIRKEMRLRYG